MISIKQKLLIEQIDRKLMTFKPLEKTVMPEKGWIHTIRTSLKMSLRQMGNRLNMSAQSVKEIETRESIGSITIKSLREAGKALDLRLVYGFVTKHESLEQMIEKRAYEIASDIVMRTSQSMKLEDQENTQERVKKSIKNRAEEIKNKMPKYLWD
jgi:predicted DNA-binding mobile mystery protein A